MRSQYLLGWNPPYVVETILADVSSQIYNISNFNLIGDSNNPSLPVKFRYTNSYNIASRILVLFIFIFYIHVIVIKSFTH